MHDQEKEKSNKDKKQPAKNKTGETHRNICRLIKNMKKQDRNKRDVHG
jgi:hypothetical protein